MSTLDKAPSNSDKTRELTGPTQEQTLDPTVVRRKQNIFKRAANSLVDGATKNGKLDLKEGIFKPAIDNIIMQTVTTIAGSIVGAFETAIFGTSSRGKSWGKYIYGSEYDYNARYRNSGSESRVTIIRNGDTEIRERNDGYSPRARQMHAFDEIFFKDSPNPGGKTAMQKAKEALDQLIDLKENYPIVRLSDFYSACQVSSSPQDREWGWRDLTGAAPRRVMGGVVIDMPQPEYIGPV